MMNRYICNSLVGYDVGKKYDGMLIAVVWWCTILWNCESLEVYRRCCKEGHCS